MTNHTPHPHPTERARIPEDASMDIRVTDTDAGEVLVELDMIGSDARNTILSMSGATEQVCADLDTLIPELLAARRVLAEREQLAEYGLGGA